MSLLLPPISLTLLAPLLSASAPHPFREKGWHETFGVIRLMA
jgi:hypothetical protein